MTTDTDYLIVGQGIAGTVMAHTLIGRGKSVLIIDDPSLSKASKVAAGLYNPVVFKRLVKSWMADELIPFMDKFYEEQEAKLNSKFYHKKQIVKLFADQAEKEFWLKKSNEEVGKYISKTIQDTFLPQLINNSAGASEVTKAGNLDMSEFLNASRNYFMRLNLLLEEKFNYTDLQISKDQVIYQSCRAKKVIFCEGHKTSENPWFGASAFKLTKGEVLTIRLSEQHSIPPEKVINKGVFILPLKSNTYKVGATYEWSQLDENPTKKGKDEIIEKLEKIVKVPFEIIDHQAGIRPTVIDRRPILGLHPDNPALVIFNGMGTKGVMLAPYFAAHLIDFLELGKELNDEVSINRFGF